MDSGIPLEGSCFELRFEPMRAYGPRLAFPCDQGGRVNLDQLKERARHNYLFARAVIGRDYYFPVVSKVDRERVSR